MIGRALILAAALAGAATFVRAADETSDPGVEVAVRFDGELRRSSREGHTQLLWLPTRGGDGLRFELQSDTAPNFPEPRVRYRGVDRGSFVSGLSEGETYFRVRAIDAADAPRGPWSDTLSVEVRYAPWWQVRTLMLVGVVVFLATVVAVVTGHRRHRAGEDAGGTGS